MVRHAKEPSFSCAVPSDPAPTSKASMGSWKSRIGYTDHMNDADGDYMAANEIMHKRQGAGGSGTADQSFPVRLHYMLNEIEGDGLSDIISWAPHGRCFVVHKQKMFTEQVLGNWFRMSKYPSFQRQLNIYGFQRLTSGADKGGYFHELFLRTKPGLAYRIQRQKVKGTGTRKAADPELEPDFYRMPGLPANKKPAWITTTDLTSKISLPGAWASTPEGSHCSLRSLAPILLAQPPPPPLPTTTGFSVYSSGAASAVGKLLLSRTSFTETSSFSLQGSEEPSAGPAHRNLPLASARRSSKDISQPTGTNISARTPAYGFGSRISTNETMATNAARGTGYVGAIVHPLLSESSTSQGPGPTHNLFNSAMSYPVGTARTNRCCHSNLRTKYDFPDLSAAMEWYNNM